MTTADLTHLDASLPPGWRAQSTLLAALLAGVSPVAVPLAGLERVAAATPVLPGHHPITSGLEVVADAQAWPWTARDAWGIRTVPARSRRSTVGLWVQVDPQGTEQAHRRRHDLLPLLAGPTALQLAGAVLAGEQVPALRPGWSSRDELTHLRATADARWLSSSPGSARWIVSGYPEPDELAAAVAGLTSGLVRRRLLAALMVCQPLQT